MKSFFGSTVRKALRASGMTKEEFAYRVLPHFLLELMKNYLRVKCVGMRHLPKKGPYIVIANHSGFMGFDALMLAHQIFQKTHRVPAIIAHKLWFFSPEISVHAHKLGLVPATYKNGLEILEEGKPLILFPEGEEGNFKPTRQRYKLKPFRRGFMRLALATGVPIIPAVVVGAEETHITLSQIRWAKDLFGIIIPIPLNVLPLPVKWKISFLPPIKVEKDLEALENMTAVSKRTHRIRLDLQKELHSQIKKRKYLFA